jgi:hypothetical protein
MGLPTRQSVSTVASKNACPSRWGSVITAQTARGSALTTVLAVAVNVSTMRSSPLATTRHGGSVLSADYVTNATPPLGAAATHPVR